VKLLLVAPIFPPEVGGVPTLYHQICLHMPPGTVVVAAAEHPDQAAFDAAQPYRIHRVPAFSEIDIPSLPAIAREAARIAAIARAECVTHVWLGHVNLSMLALLWRPFTSLPMFLYAHGEEIVQDYGGRLYAMAKRRFLKTVPRMVAVSHYTGHALEQFAGENARVAVIPNAVDSEAFFPQPKDPDLLARYGITDKKLLLTVARLETRKGHDRVIQALPKIAASVPEVHYLVVGGGEERERLENLARETGVADRVTFAQGVPQSELCRTYNLADLFIMPNRRLDNDVTEGFGIVFLEAGACAKPVIGGRDGGVPDAIMDGETGYLVDGDDVDAIAQRSIELLSDPDKAGKMGDLGRRFAIDHDYPALVERLLDFVGETGEATHAA